MTDGIFLFCVFKRQLFALSSYAFESNLEVVIFMKQPKSRT